MHDIIASIFAIVIHPFMIANKLKFHDIFYFGSVLSIESCPERKFTLNAPDAWGRWKTETCSGDYGGKCIQAKAINNMRNKDKNKMSIETGLWTMNMDSGGRTFWSFVAVRLIRMESAHAFGVRFDFGLLLEP